jgi:hypothetical protein
MRSGWLGLAVLALMFTSASALIACGDDGENDAEFEEYFAVVAPEMLALEQDLTALSEAAQDLTSEPLAENLDAYADTLDASRLIMAEVRAPGDAGEPHARLIAASEALVLVTEQQAQSARGDTSVPSGEDLAAQGLSRASEWYAACHDLQDIALVREIDADMRCVTALGG